MPFRIEELIVNVVCEADAEKASAVVVIFCTSMKSPRGCGGRSRLKILGEVGEKHETTKAELAEIKAQLKEALAELEKEL